VVTSGQNGVNYLFGNVLAITVSGTVYLDVNGTGAYSSSDPGLAGITLTLSGTNNLGQGVTGTTTTAADGTYLFSADASGNGLRPGTYQVTETQPSGYLAGTTSVGTVNGTSDGTVVATGKIGSIVLSSGQFGINYNFGEVQPVTISGIVYVDQNGNGVLDAADTGFAGITLSLSGTNNLGQSITATVTTAANGTYSFTTDSGGNGIRPGTYQVTETQPSGYLPGTTSVGTVNSTADGTVVATGKIGSIALTSGQGGINYDFGEVQPVTISGAVYLDTDGNGVFDAGNSAFAGVTLTLTGTNGLGQSITATTTSAANGTYSFTVDGNGNVLLPGTYQIADTAPSGYVQDAANIGTVNGSPDGNKASPALINSIGMTSGQNGINYNFGLNIPAGVSGYAYLDINRNNVFDTGDTGFSGLTVTLTGTNALGQSINLTTTTDVNGYYAFTGLFGGTYSIVLTAPGGIYNTEVANVGTVNGAAVGVANSTVEIDQVQLKAGQSGINYDFGILRPLE
jgi:hypothetical protein